MKKRATVLVCAVLVGAVQAGTTYRCTDGAGKVTVTQDNPIRFLAERGACAPPAKASASDWGRDIRP